MDREQIVKALENAIRMGKFYSYMTPKLSYEELKGALALIRELTEENGKLTINMNAYGLTAKRLAEENEILASHHKTACDAAKIDTVRKMQERLKATAVGFPEGTQFVAVGNIDQIAEDLLAEGYGAK